MNYLFIPAIEQHLNENFDKLKKKIKKYILKIKTKNDLTSM